MWYASGANGIGTLGGWNNTIWLDFDTKQFCDQDSCDTAVLNVCDSIKSQTGEEPFLEKSHSGGWHVGVRARQKPNFTNFALSAGGKHVGEALGDGRFVVLAPTVGPSGKAYESINRPNKLPIVESLESIGIYAVKDLQNKSSKIIPSQRIIVEGYVPNAIPLESLGSEISRQILNGGNPYNDRSESLTAAIKEWYGWENWARANHVTYSGSTQQLAEYAGGQLGIDANRIGRILKTIDPDQCHPAALSKGDEESCWKKIRRLSKEAYESYCPPTIKSALRSLITNPQSPIPNLPEPTTKQQTTNNKQQTTNFPTLSTPDPEIADSGLVAAIQKILDKGLSEAETRSSLIGLARVLGLSRTDVEAIAKEIEVQNIRAEDLQADAKQFQRLVSFRDQDLDLFEIFPRPLAQALLSKAESSRIDPIRLVQSLLPAGGTMLGNYVRIIAKYGATVYDHWFECPIFWCADVSAPSSGKTDAQRAVFAALKHIQNQEYTRVEEAKKQLVQLEEKWKLLTKEEKLDRIGTEEDPEYFKKNNIDNLRRYLWDEVTTEALFKLISKQPENSGSCLLKDELQGLFLGMDQFKTGRGNGIQQLLTAWSSPLSGSVDRVDDSKSYRFNNQTLNLCGSIQPEVARKSLDVASDPDGFTSRVLFGMSKIPNNFEEWSDAQVDLFNCIRGLLEGLEQMQGTLEYSPSAYNLQKTYWATLKKGYRHYLESNPAYAYFLGKQNSYVHRFALLLHCIEHYYAPKPNFNEVCIGTVRKAIALSQYYCGQFRLLQAISSKPDEPQLDGLLYRVWEKVKSIGKFSTRELCHFARRQKWRGEKMSGAAALDILKTIAGCGFGELKDKTLYFKPSTPPDDEGGRGFRGEGEKSLTSIPDEEQSLDIEQTFSPAPLNPLSPSQEDECGQCGQMWSDCPHPQSEEESDFEASVVNCGRDLDTCSETHEVVEDVEDLEQMEQIEQTSSTSPDRVEDVEEVQVEVIETEENSVVEEVAEVREIVVGSKVLWPKCPAHWETWSPFVVEFIQDDGMVKLEMAQFLVPLAELILADA